MTCTPQQNLQQSEQADTPTEALQRFIKLREVKALTTLSTSEIYRRIAAGTFPQQVLLGPKSAVWIKKEVIA